jgi:membrane protein
VPVRVNGACLHDFSSNPLLTPVSQKKVKRGEGFRRAGKRDKKSLSLPFFAIRSKGRVESGNAGDNLILQAPGEDAGVPGGKAMTTQTSSPHAAQQEEQDRQAKPEKVVKTVEKDIKPATSFLTKFNNDWVMNFAAGLAFNILTALVPMVIAIVSITGLVVGGLNPAARTQLIEKISSIFPSTLSANGQNLLAPVLISLSKNAGFLGIIAIVLAVFGGSRLFVTLEGYFDVIYHTRPRNVVKQNIMAFSMMLVFVVLVPVMIFAGSGPALVFSLLRATPLGNVPGIDLLFGLGGLLTGVLFAWVFFLVIYIVVPNQRISFRNSWLGALVAAILVQLYLTLFPFYVTHFLNNYTGSAGATGFAIILLFFLYYFSVILLLGAEINAYFAEKIHATPESIPAMVHRLTSHMPTSEPEVKEEAAASHKDEEPKKILPQSQAEHLENQARGKTAQAGASEQPEDEQSRQAQPVHAHERRKADKKKSSASKGSARSGVVGAVAGTALAFFVEMLRLRKKEGDMVSRQRKSLRQQHG